MPPEGIVAGANAIVSAVGPDAVPGITESGAMAGGAVNAGVVSAPVVAVTVTGLIFWMVPV